MQMRMMDQILAPRVENGEETDFGAEMLRIGGDKPQCLCSDMEENAVDGSLVLQGDGGNLFRHCKNNVKVRDAQKLRLTILNPFGPRQRLALWTVTIAAGNGEISITCLRRECLNHLIVLNDSHC